MQLESGAVTVNGVRGKAGQEGQISNLTLQTGPSHTRQHQTVQGQRLQGLPGSPVQLRKTP